MAVLVDRALKRVLDSPTGLFSRRVALALDFGGVFVSARFRLVDQIDYFRLI
jgi:hypothetical protein